jgi:hypothetical protein
MAAGAICVPGYILNHPEFSLPAAMQYTLLFGAGFAPFCAFCRPPLQTPENAA